MAGCPVEMIGRQVHSIDGSRIEVSVHRAHDDGAGADRHGRTSVTLDVEGVEAGPASRKNTGVRAELSGDDVFRLAGTYLAPSLKLVRQLVPGSWVAPREYADRRVMVMRTSSLDTIAVKAHLGREGGAGGLQAVTFVEMAVRPGDDDSGHAGATVVIMLPDELRGLIALLRRAGACAAAADR